MTFSLQHFCTGKKRIVCHTTQIHGWHTEQSLYVRSFQFENASGESLGGGAEWEEGNGKRKGLDSWKGMGKKYLKHWMEDSEGRSKWK